MYKKVTIARSAHHQQFTITFLIKLSEAFLPMHLIYQETSRKSHPKCLFPGGFDVAHISKHWSNEEKAKEILLKVLIPCVRKTRKNMQLHNGKEWLLILDVFGGQWLMK